MVLFEQLVQIDREELGDEAQVLLVGEAFVVL